MTRYVKRHTLLILSLFFPPYLPYTPRGRSAVRPSASPLPFPGVLARGIKCLFFGATFADATPETPNGSASRIKDQPGWRVSVLDAGSWVSQASIKRRGLAMNLARPLPCSLVSLKPHFLSLCPLHLPERLLVRLFRYGVLPSA